MILVANWIHIELALILHLDSVVFYIKVCSFEIHRQIVFNVLFQRTVIRPANIKKFLTGSFRGQTRGSRRAVAWGPKVGDKSRGGMEFLGSGSEALTTWVNDFSLFWPPEMAFPEQNLSTVNDWNIIILGIYKIRPARFSAGKRVTRVLYSNVGSNQHSLFHVTLIRIFLQSLELRCCICFLFIREGVFSLSLLSL